MEIGIKFCITDNHPSLSIKIGKVERTCTKELPDVYGTNLIDHLTQVYRLDESEEARLRHDMTIAHEQYRLFQLLSQLSPQVHF